MTHYTDLTDASIHEILSVYGVSNFDSYKLLSGGSENSNYIVKSKDIAYVVTVCEQKSLQKTRELGALLEYLADNDFSSSKIIKTIDGQLAYLWNNKPVMLKLFIKGKILKQLSPTLLTYLGRELATLHCIPAPDYLPQHLSYGKECFDDVKKYAAESEFYTWLKKTQCYIEQFANTELPKALIHSDIFYNNIIVSPDNKQATIMDFEEASYYYRVFDIGMMITGTCCDDEKLSLDKAKHLLKGYQQKQLLLDTEVNALQAFTVYAATATAFWRHQNFNYVNVTPKMKEHYMAMKNLADNIMSISAEKFKQLILN